MYSFKLEKCGREGRLINVLRSLLLMWVALLAVHAVEAQPYNWKSVVIKGGGFVTGIVPHPNAPGLMYCRTDVGGAYRWNATDGSWIPLQDYIGYPNEDWSLYGVESIALDPQDTNRLYMTCGWLGVGRPSAVLISTNQGASFTRVNTSFTMEANSDGRSNGERLAVDPNLGSILFNGTRRDGLWKSVNYGASWSKVASFPVNTTTNNVGLVFVEFIKSSGINGSATPEIWVGVSQGGDNLYRSTDGGNSWSVVTSGAPSSYMPHRAAQDGLGNMYVTLCNGPGPNNVTAGSVRKLNLTTLASTDATPPTGQGGFAGVSVDKQNPNTLVVSTIDRWWPHDEVYRSTNGGASWTALYAGATIDGSSAPWICFNAATPPVPHWIGDVRIDPFNSNRVYHVSGGGVYSSYNLTAAKPSWEFRSDGIEEMGLWPGGSAICSPPSGPLIFTALGDIGGFAHHDVDVSPAKQHHYNRVYASNTSVDFAESNPNIVVRTHWGAPRGSRSTDGGETWTDFATHPSAADTDVGVIAISATGGRLVWSSPGSRPSYSTDNGATWNLCGGNLTPSISWELPLLFSDRVNGNKFYLYMPSTGVVHLSTDGGANFVAGPTISTWCETMRTVYGFEGHVWIASTDGNSSNAGLWRSTNSGASFTKIGGIQNAKSIGFGRTASGSGHPVLYMNGQINNTWGVFRSEDLAANWTRINDDQHQYGSISQVIGDPKIYGRCYFAGRGVLYGDMPALPPLAPSLIATASNTAVSLTWNAPSGADSYTVKRATVSGGPYTEIASGLTATSYVDTGLVNGTTYYYVVAATNIYGVGPDSTEASATPSDSWARYAFEGNAQDTSGHGFHGTATALTYVAGKVGSQAAQFNGSGGSVTIPPSVTDDFTVTMWVKTTDTAGTAGAQWWNGKGLVDGEIGGGGADWGTSIVNGKFVLGIGAASGDTTVASSVNINDGNWHHVAATRHNTSGAMQVYVDGVLSGSGTGPTGPRNWPTSLRIGGLQPESNFLNGTLDEVRLYGRILSVEEIAESSGLPPAAPAGFAATAGSGGITLSWSASAFSTDYQVKRSTTAGSGYTTIATVSGTTFTDTAVNDGTTYYYVVTAGNASGESGNSAEIATRTDALVLHLKLDETSGTTASDSSGYGRNATLVNGPAFATGKLDNALGLTSTSSQHAALPAGLVSTLSDFTISAWVNPATLDTWARVFDLGSGTGTNMFLTTRAWPTDRPRFAIRIANSAEQAIEAATPLGTGAWTHIAVTLSGTTGTLYINGVASGSNNAITFDPAGMGSTTQNYLARSQWPDPYFNGALDDFRIYNRALASGEIQVLAAGQLPAPQNPTATAGNAQISLAWSAVPGATGYTVRRSANSGGPYTDLATGVAATAYTDTGLAAGTAWHYTIAATGLPGTGVPSAPVSATAYTEVEIWRMAHFGIIASTGNAADSADPDGDGWNNGEEYVSGTDPNSRTSLLKIDQLQASGSDMVVGFPTVLGRTYRVERSPSLQETSWLTVQENIVGTGGTVQIIDPGGTGQARRFYRIVVGW